MAAPINVKAQSKATMANGVMKLQQRPRRRNGVKMVKRMLSGENGGEAYHGGESAQRRRRRKWRNGWRNIQSMAWRNVENISSDVACAIIGAVMKTENWLFNGMASVMAYHEISENVGEKASMAKKAKALGSGVNSENPAA
jgi:hypothetical protein